MDADRNIIPIVEGDQGEGFMDEIDPLDPQGFGARGDGHLKSEEMGYQEQVKKKLSEAKALAEQSPSPKRMTIKKGMIIHFYGFAYKCTAARPNGKVTLKFKGPWKGDQDGLKTQNKKN